MPDWGEEGGGDIGGGDGDESFNDDGNALLSLVSGNTSSDTSKASLGDANFLTFMEMGVVLGNKGYVAVVYSTEDAQAFHLSFGDYKWATNELAIKAFLRIVKSEVGEVLVVVNKMLNFLEGTMSEKDVGDA